MTSDKAKMIYPLDSVSEFCSFFDGGDASCACGHSATDYVRNYVIDRVRIYNSFSTDMTEEIRLFTGAGRIEMTIPQI